MGFQPIAEHERLVNVDSSGMPLNSHENSTAQDELLSPAASMGFWRIYTIDKDGNRIISNNPSDPDAVDIYFGLQRDAPQPLPQEYINTLLEFNKLLNVIRKIYYDVEPKRIDTFRGYYVRLFHLAKLAFEGVGASPALAKDSLVALTLNIIDDESGRVKNGHLQKLGKYVIWYTLGFLTFYILLELLPIDTKKGYLINLGLDRHLTANFLLLWIGCFIGVWLSYGLRASNLTLTDIINTDRDRLIPQIRLIFAGLFTMIVGMLLVLQVIDISFGNLRLSDVATNKMLAVLIGIFCGISELALPESIGARARKLVEDIK